MEHLNSRTFQGLSRAWNFFYKIQGLLKDPMNPVQLITDKTNAADLSSDVFALLINVTPTKKIQNSLPFHKFRQKLANSDVKKEVLNCTASL